MTPTQLRTIITNLGLSQEALGRFLGYNDGRQVRRWLRGNAEIDVPTAKLLRLMVRLKISPDDVK